MQDIIIQIMENYGYIGIMSLIAIENIFPPIPSEVILTFGGVMTTMTDLTVLGVIIASTIGALIGAILLYMVGSLVRDDYLKNLLSGKMGKILRLKPSDIDNAQRWFNAKGKITVFICRFIPVIRSLISIPAGMANMNIAIFIIYTTIGTLIWNTVLIKLGVFAGNSWEKVVAQFGSITTLIFAIFAIFVAIFVIIFYKKRIKDDKEDDK